MYDSHEVKSMMIDTDLFVTMTDANQNFSKVARLVDKEGLAVILKNNQPRYVVVDFEEYEAIAAAAHARKASIAQASDAILDENMEAFLELAK